MLDGIRYSIHVPDADNTGARVPAAHAHAAAHLLSKFGGFTSTAARGEWRSNGTTYADEQTIYTVDVPGTAEQLARAYDVFIALAKRVRKMARQECVYVTRTPMAAEFIDN